MTDQPRQSGVGLQARSTPCGSCPYRQDCPSGIWDASEYAKLPAYDRETFKQPIGVFMCHSDNDRVTLCRGWLDVHPKEDSLSLRLAVATDRVSAEIFDLPASGVAVFGSGQEAAEHGMREIKAPPPGACAMIGKLLKLRKRATTPAGEADPEERSELP